MSPMRIGRDRLQWLALATLAEQVELARDGAPAPSHGVRLALAVLFEFSDGERRPFDDFWRQMRRDEANSFSQAAASYSRSTYLQTQLRGVMRAVGVQPCVASELPLHEAALRVHPRRKPVETP